MDGFIWPSSAALGIGKQSESNSALLRRRRHGLPLGNSPRLDLALAAVEWFSCPFNVCFAMLEYLSAAAMDGRRETGVSSNSIAFTDD